MAPEIQSINPTSDRTIKLLSEIFIAGDDTWQESIKTYVISLFLSDISSSFPLDKFTMNVQTNKNLSTNPFI